MIDQIACDVNSCHFVILSFLYCVSVLNLSLSDPLFLSPPPLTENIREEEATLHPVFCKLSFTEMCCVTCVFSNLGNYVFNCTIVQVARMF